MKATVVLDCGTTGNRVLAFSKSGKVLAKSYYEFPLCYPRPGWVEQNPMDIWNTTIRAFRNVRKKVGGKNIACIGITNQRETTIVWDKSTGKPVYNAIVWQCRRTADACKRLSGSADLVRKKTGLPLDPYFSATKIKWILDNVQGVRARARKGELLFGTVDSWILWNLTGGKVHATEPGNASRTMCFNIHSLQWDKELLKLFRIPAGLLPRILPSGGEFGCTDKKAAGGEYPVTGILGDQQASLFGQGGWDPRVVKNTYGTGLFLMGSMNGPEIRKNGLITTIGWQVDGKVVYAFEGSVFVGGAALQWLRDGLKLIKNAGQSEKLARSLDANDGVYFVPALTGLGAPHWDPHARGTIVGITRGTKPEHLCRAALEALAYQTRDVVEVWKGAGHRVSRLRVDGGAAANNFLMQFQADQLGIPVERPVNLESTAFGVAGIAGMAAGFWSRDRFFTSRKIDRVFKPGSKPKTRNSLYAGWKRALERSLG